MKTLGQIARDAYDAAAHDYRRTADQQDHEWWEAAARAVRAQVIEECLQAVVDLPFSTYQVELALGLLKEKGAAKVDA